jgi:hypothetical protein
MEEEQHEVPAAFKKGYNQADMLFTYMPNVLKGVNISDRNETDYDKGFNARLQEELERKKQREKEAPKDMHQVRRMLDKDTDHPGKEQSKERGPDKSR